MKGMLTIGKSEIIKFAVDFGSNNPQFVRICWTNSLFQFWKERVRSPLMARFTRYNIMWYSLSVTCDRSEVFSSYSGFLHHWNWSPQYSWNIVESGGIGISIHFIWFLRTGFWQALQGFFTGPGFTEMSPDNKSCKHMAWR